MIVPVEHEFGTGARENASKVRRVRQMAPAVGEARQGRVMDENDADGALATEPLEHLARNLDLMRAKPPGRNEGRRLNRGVQADQGQRPRLAHKWERERLLSEPM